MLDDASYDLLRDFVDGFANEVQGRQPKNPPVQSRRNFSEELNGDEGNWTDNDDAESVEGDPTNGASPSLDLPASTSLDFNSNGAPAPTTSTSATDTGTDSANATPDQLGATPLDPMKATLAKKLLEQCVKNWKAAAREEKKQMWQMFNESGLFASACRHGLILWLVDMVRSGEL